MVFIPVVLAVVVWLWPAIWFRVIHNRLEVNVNVGGQKVEIGGCIPIEIRVRNRSWLPCPFVQLVLELPPGMSAYPDRSVTGIIRTTFLLMRQEVIMQVECYGWRRGQQDLRHKELLVRVNEGFGIRELFITREVQGTVIVLPKRVSSPGTMKAIREVNGDIERMHWIMPDESLLRGIRSYEQGDPFKHIAWQATARTGTWMTKQFSSSTDLSVGLILNAQFFEPHWLGTDVDLFDEMCSVVTALCEDLERRRVPFYFASNAVYPGYVKQQWYGRTTSHAVRRITGSMVPYTSTQLTPLLSLCTKRLSQAVPIVLCTGFISEAQASHLAVIATLRKVIVVCPSTATIPEVKGVRIMRFESRPLDEAERDGATGTPAPKRYGEEERVAHV